LTPAANFPPDFKDTIAIGHTLHEIYAYQSESCDKYVTGSITSVICRLYQHLREFSKNSKKRRFQDNQKMGGR
jgi:hypothetical protein